VVTGSRGARVIAQPHSLDKAASPAATSTAAVVEGASGGAA
jgi:hypothetical protein